VIVAAMIGYQVWDRLVGRPSPAGPPTFAGMPASSIGVESPDGRVRTLRAKPGAKLDPEVVRKFVEMEQAKGRVVVEGAPGYYVSTPPRQTTEGQERK
jgi:hypothetical protein